MAVLGTGVREHGPVSAPALERPPTPGDLPAPGPDPVVVGAVGGIGDRLGRHGRPVKRSTAIRVIVALTLLTSLLGLWQKSPCRVHPWQDEYQYTRACYTDVFALYFAEDLAQRKAADGAVVSPGSRPYLEHPVEYPVVIGAAMGVVAKIVHVFPDDQAARRFFDLTWSLLTACAVVVAVTTARLAGRRRTWDAAMFALAPGLLLHATTNWDLIAAALAGLGLLQWARRRPLAAGVLLGLATATKLYPALFLLPLLVLCLRARQVRAWSMAAGALVASVAVLTVPVYLVSPSFAEVNGQQTQVAASPWDRIGVEGLSALRPTTKAVIGGKQVTGVNSVYRFVELNKTRGADWDSLPFALQTARDATSDTSATTWGKVTNWVADAAAGLVLDKQVAPGAAPTRLNTSVTVLFLLLLAPILLLAWRAPRRPRLPQLLFLTMVAFLLSNKVFSPQYVIWLLPLAILARPRWRPFLAWQLTEVLVLLSRFYFFVGNDKPGQGLGITWFIGAVLLRDVALLVLSGLVVRDILRPELDVVRQVESDHPGCDDPAGGVLSGAPDRRLVTRVRLRRSAAS